MVKRFGVQVPVDVKLPDFGISVFVSRHAGQFRMKTTYDKHHEIALVTGGQGVVELDGTSIPISAGAVVRIAHHTGHRFVDDPKDPLALSVLCVSRQAAGVLPLDIWANVERELLLGEARWLSAHALLEMRHLMRQIALKCSELKPYTATCAAGMASQLLATVLDELQTTPPGRLSEPFSATILWIDHHFTEPINVEDLAEKAGVSYRTYTQHFREATGESVVDYVTRLRIQYAVRSLRSTGDILDSAMAAGFGDLSHFYRVFRKFTGTTPRAFMQDANSEDTLVKFS